jgi:predicted PhzF superfamily epimerase YddE/YHI9
MRLEFCYIDVFQRKSSAEVQLQYFLRQTELMKKSTYRVSQGKEIGREARIYTAFDKIGKEIKNIRIGGEAVKVLEGKI